MSASIKKFIIEQSNRRFVRYGLPFMSFLVAATFGLEKYAKLRYDFTSRSSVSSRQFEELMKNKKATPEAVYETLHRNESTVDWGNIRGPRPWENSKDIQEAQRKYRETKVKKVTS